VPPGTYELRLRLGSRTGDAVTGVQVEARRTVLAPVATRRGRIVTESVTVNVRTPESMPDGQEGDGTPGLQVHLTGSAPALAGIEVLPRPAAPQLFIVSDSTASDWLVGPKRGWGQELPQLFRSGLSVANYADSGSGTVSWLADPTLFATVQPLVRPGDEVLIQLAHNDKTTTEEAYRANLETLVAGVRSRGGRPVLVTPPCRHLFAADGTVTPTGRVVNNLGVDLPAVIRDEAAKLAVPLVDLTARSQALLEQLGPDASWDLYLTTARDGVQDATHFSGYGATVMAGLVAGGLRDAHLPAARFLR
jgi:lysophospholipase L1-like esterase